MGGLEHCSATAGAVGDRGPAALCQLRAEPGDAAGADPVRLWPLPVGMLAAGVAMRPTASSRRSPWHAPRSSATRLGSYAGTVIFWPSRTRPRPPKLWRQHPPPRFPPSTRNWPPSARLSRASKKHSTAPKRCWSATLCWCRGARHSGSQAWAERPPLRHRSMASNKTLCVPRRLRPPIGDERANSW